MSGIRTRFHGHGDGTFTLQRIDDDVEPIIEANKALQNEPQPRTDGLKHIASIPAVLIEKWILEEQVPVLCMPEHEFAKFIRRKLNDPQYRYLKTTGGSI